MPKQTMIARKKFYAHGVKLSQRAAAILELVRMAGLTAGGADKLLGFNKGKPFGNLRRAGSGKLHLHLDIESAVPRIEVLARNNVTGEAKNLAKIDELLSEINLPHSLPVIYGIPNDDETALSRIERYLVRDIIGEDGLSVRELENITSQGTVTVSEAAQNTALPGHRLISIKLSGRGAHPKYPRGSEVLVDLRESDVPDSGEYLIYRGGSWVVMRCQRMGHPTPSVRLTHINPDFGEPETVPLDSLIVGGVVCCRLRPGTGDIWDESTVE